MLRPLRLGLIGLGYWGPNYLRIFSQLDGCKVAACADSNPKRTETFKKNHPRSVFTATLRTC